MELRWSLQFLLLSDLFLFFAQKGHEKEAAPIFKYDVLSGTLQDPDSHAKDGPTNDGGENFEKRDAVIEMKELSMEDTDVSPSPDISLPIHVAQAISI